MKPEAVFVPKTEIQKMNDLYNFFSYEHLPEKLQQVSKPFNELAKEMLHLPMKNEEEAIAGLRKLLEAKDCFVRSVIQTASPLAEW